MKKNYWLNLLITLFFYSNFQAQTSNIHVSGKHILGPCNDTLILKGVNYAPYNWGWSNTQLRLNQIVLSGANCVRMPWYVNTPDGPTPQATYNNLVYLDSALSKCIQYKMIPIIELHDQTCLNNPTNLITLANWFVLPAVKILINKYKHSIILNIANEALWVGWASNPTAAQVTFTSTYNTIVNTIRTNSITVPIMIDGPECGTNLDVLANVGQSLETADPLGNLIFSAHAYWYAYAGNDSTQTLNKINYAISKNIPFVFGEVANLQDATTMCQYTLNYKPWLKIMKQKKIGWMAWSWDNDGCPARQMTTNGNYSSLTTYGNDIINNTIYGLSVGTVKSKYLMLGGCGISAGVTETLNDNNVVLYPSPSKGIFSINGPEIIKAVEVFDVLGKHIAIESITKNTYSTKDAVSGIYFVKICIANTVITKRLIIE